MHRAQYLVAREGGFNRDFRRLGIADFTNHYDVRILAQNGAQRIGESQPDFFFGRHLVDARDLEFDRIFDRDDVIDRVIEFVEGRIKGRRLARAGWTSDEDQTMRRVHRAFELGEGLGVQAELIDAGREVGLVQQAEDDLLAVDRGHDRDAQIVVFATDANAHAPVLRQSALGDVQAAHDLEARRQRQLHLLGRRRGIQEHSINAVAQPQCLFEWLDVNIAGTVFYRLH